MGGKKSFPVHFLLLFDISFRIEKPLMMWITCNFKTTETFVRNFWTIKINFEGPNSNMVFLLLQCKVLRYCKMKLK